MKRVFDFTLALVGLVVTSPVVAVAAVLVRLDSRGPAFYSGARVGRNGSLFQMHKLRTMHVDSDRKGPAVTGARDPRVTKVGRFLRRTKTDELPQLLNVLRGEMSLVGPRPESPAFVEHYTSEQRQILSVRPGMTGPAALAYINEEEELGHDDPEAAYIGSVMPAKLRIDLDYVRTASFSGDLKILAKTVWMVLGRQRGRGTAN